MALKGQQTYVLYCNIADSFANFAKRDYPHFKGLVKQGPCTCRAQRYDVQKLQLTREKELIDLLKTENIDFAFLTETDTRSLLNEDSYTVAGYKTVLPIKKPVN